MRKGVFALVRYVLQRLALMLITIFIIVSATFIFTRLLPGGGLDDPDMDATLRERLIIHYGLDRPVHEQYFIFMRRLILEGHLGYSTRLWSRQPVLDNIMLRLPITIQLNIFANILIYPLGLLFGIIMGVKHNTKTDHTLNVFMMLAISVPSFVLAALLQYLLAFRLELFPIMLSTDGPNEWVMTWPKFHSMILPILAMSFAPIMGIARTLRGELTEVLTSDFMLLAKTKGLSHRQATIRHSLRNSFLPLTGLIPSLFTSVLMGSLVVESFFGIPGVSAILVNAINLNDAPVIIGWLLLFTTISLLSVIITDLLFGVVDPRIRMGGRKSAA